MLCYLINLKKEHKMSYVIFSIDNEDNPHSMQAFLDTIVDIQIEHNTSTMIPCVGSYKGKKEDAFMWSLRDFDDHIRGSVFVKHQESVLHVASGNKMEAELEYLSEQGFRIFLGCMHQVCKEEALASDAYTYRPELNMYWVAKHGNPDGSYRRSKEAFQ